MRGTGNAILFCSHPYLFQIGLIILGVFLVVASAVETGLTMGMKCCIGALVFNVIVMLYVITIFFFKGREKYCVSIAVQILLTIARFVYIIWHAIEYGNQYNESDPAAENYPSWFFNIPYLRKSFTRELLIGFHDTCCSDICGIWSDTK